MQDIGTSLHVLVFFTVEMKSRKQMKIFAVLLAAAAVLAGGDLDAQSQDTTLPMRWNSFDAGLEQAKNSHKKVLVDVYTEWCGWCAKMDSEVYSDPGVKDYLSRNFVLIRMNAEGEGKVHYKGEE